MIVEAKKNWLKFIVGWAVCFAIRLFPYRPPNVEPVLATQMPFAKRYGWVGGFLFGFLSIAIFDFFTGKVGMWTWITAVTYGALGIVAFFFFKSRESKITNYLGFGIVGTILYDAVTGLSIGPLMFGQSFMEAFVGQIPFTAMHLLGTVIFSVVVSPALYRWVVANEALDAEVLWRRCLALIGVRS